MTEHIKGECYEGISTKITDFYNSKGLEYHEPLGLIPGEDDKSVTFTSATINNFKGYLRGEEEIPVNGVYTIQNCLRTRNLDYRYGFEETPRFGSYFRMFGLIRRPNFLLKTYADTIEFIESELGVPSESIVVHKSSKHDIFNELMEKIRNNIGLKIKLIGIIGNMGRRVFEVRVLVLKYLISQI